MKKKNGNWDNYNFDMANPFETLFDGSCDSCFSDTLEGEMMYAHEGSFICEDCASYAHLICECGNYKKEHFTKCFKCHENEEEIKSYDDFKNA